MTKQKGLYLIALILGNISIVMINALVYQDGYHPFYLTRMSEYNLVIPFIISGLVILVALVKLILKEKE